MSVIYGIPELFGQVAAAFASYDPVPHLFGWREPVRKTTSEARVLWVPGDDSGSLGELAAPKRPGMFPRHLANLNELVTIYCVSGIATETEDELAQYKRARALFDQELRHILLIRGGLGNVFLSAPKWHTQQPQTIERRMGVAIKFLLALPQSVLDISSPIDEITATNAEALVSLNNETPETVEVP